MITSVAKNAGFRTAEGDAARAVFEDHLNASPERLRTDCVDAHHIRGISGEQLGMLHDPGMEAALEAHKKSGKIRFAGSGYRDGKLLEILAAAATGRIDQVLIRSSSRSVGGCGQSDDLNRALDRAAEASAS